MSGHTFTKIGHHREVVFGGWTGGNRLNDAYVLDMDTWVWWCAIFSADLSLSCWSLEFSILVHRST